MTKHCKSGDTVPLNWKYPKMDTDKNTLTREYGVQIFVRLPGEEYKLAAEVLAPAVHYEYPIPKADLDGDIVFKVRAGRKAIMDPGGQCHRVKWGKFGPETVVTVISAPPEAPEALTVGDVPLDDGCVDQLMQLTVGD